MKGGSVRRGGSSPSVDALLQQQPMRNCEDLIVFMILCIVLTIMQDIRDRYPSAIPCIVHLPNGRKLKLLLPQEANMAFLNSVCRKKIEEASDPSVGIFLVHGRTLCSGTCRVASLDTNKPDAIIFHLRHESTFG